MINNWITALHNYFIFFDDYQIFFSLAPREYTTKEKLIISSLLGANISSCVKDLQSIRSNQYERIFAPFNLKKYKHERKEFTFLFQKN